MTTFINGETNFRVASFKLGGKKYELIPSELKNIGNSYYLDAGNLRASLTFESGCDYGLWTLGFENTGAENTPRITEAYTIDLDLPVNAAAKLHTLRGDDCSQLSFKPIDIELDAKYDFKPNGGRSSCTTAFPYFDITDGAHTALFAIGWTGQWKCSLTPSEGFVNVSAGLEYCDFYLKSGESVRGASIYYMGRENDPAAVRREFKHIQRRDFNPVKQTGKDTLPFSIQPFDRYFWNGSNWASEEGQLKTLEGAKKCGGFDTLWIDAAWFRLGFPHGVGNYSFSDGFPRGLKPVSDAVHAAGMRFMVWFEPERIYEGSEIFKNHDEFLLSVPGDPNTKLYNLGDETAWNWLHETLRDFIADNGIDNYRQDFNMEPLGYWLGADGEGRQGVTEMKYIAGLYRLWDALREDFPKLFIDDCSSGGRRIDFEMMRRSAPMWRSDTNCGPATDERHNYTWNQNHTLELGEYLIYHAGAAWEPITYRIRSAATAGFAGTFDVLNPDYDFDNVRTVLGEAAKLAKYWQLEFYPMTAPTNDETGFCVWRFEDEAQSYGCAYIFRRNECKDEMFSLAIPTLKPEKEYRLTMSDENHTVTVKTVAGSELVSGYGVKLDQPMTSMVIEYLEI